MNTKIVVMKEALSAGTRVLINILRVVFVTSLSDRLTSNIEQVASSRMERPNLFQNVAISTG